MQGQSQEKFWGFGILGIPVFLCIPRLLSQAWIHLGVLSLENFLNTPMPLIDLSLHQCKVYIFLSELYGHDSASFSPRLNL